ncbi:MAG: hypothetical protein KAX19_10060 [Candidatus Brocadiae bacterium]|nr:hypothetical protein [Candidatus Brocadiia bacterium]
MPRAEKLFRFLARLLVRRFYGTVTIRFEAGKVTHVETEKRRMSEYKHLPERVEASSGTSSKPETGRVPVPPKETT